MNLRKTGVHLITIVLLLFTGSCSDKIKDTISYTADRKIVSDFNRIVIAIGFRFW